MKRIIIALFSVIATIAMVSCGGGTGDGNTNTDNTASNSKNGGNQTINISIYLDLSDRLIRDNLQPDQMYRDTTIINYIVDYFQFHI